MSLIRNQNSGDRVPNGNNGLLWNSSICRFFFGNFCNFIMFYLAGQLEMYLFILNMSVEKPK